jgi:hypothetical protein
MSQFAPANYPLNVAQEELLNTLLALPDRPDNTWFLTKDGGVFFLDQVVGGGVTVTNGLDIISGSVGLGGTLVQDTTIDGDLMYSFTIVDASGINMQSTGNTTLGGQDTEIFANNIAIFGTTSAAGATSIRTPGIVAGTATAGQIPVLIDETTGEIEYQDAPASGGVDTINYVPMSIIGSVASTTVYHSFAGLLSGTTPESQMQQSFKRDVILKEFFVAVQNYGGQVFSGNTTITLRKNGVDTAYSIVVPAGTVGDPQEFLVPCNESFSSTDLVSYSVITGAGTGAFYPTIYTRVQTDSTPIPDTFLTATVTVTAAQIANIFNTPIEIIPAVIGKTIVPISTTISKTNSFVFTGGSGVWRIGINCLVPATYNNTLSPLEDNSGGGYLSSTFPNNKVFSGISNPYQEESSPFTIVGKFATTGTAPTITGGSDIVINIMYRLV